MRAPLVAPAPPSQTPGVLGPWRGLRLPGYSGHEGGAAASPQPSSGLVFNRRDWTTIRPVLTMGWFDEGRDRRFGAMMVAATVFRLPRLALRPRGGGRLP